jgi:hypothetical protein
MEDGFRTLLQSNCQKGSSKNGPWKKANSKWQNWPSPQGPILRPNEAIVGARLGVSAFNILESGRVEGPIMYRSRHFTWGIMPWELRTEPEVQAAMPGLKCLPGMSPMHRIYPFMYHQR